MAPDPPTIVFIEMDRREYHDFPAKSLNPSYPEFRNYPLPILRQWRIMTIMVIVETGMFTRIISSLISDDEYRALQVALIQRPAMGAIITGTGGLRKLRWKLEGKGKSGGIRTIYYWMKAEDQLFMLYAYTKNSQDNLTSEQKKILKQIVETWNDEESSI